MQFDREAPSDYRGLAAINDALGGVMVPIAIAGRGLGIIGLLVVILLVVLIVRML